MTDVAKNQSDSESWSKGNGEFHLTSKSTVTNRRTDIKRAYHSGSESDSRPQQYTVYRTEDDVSRGPAAPATDPQNATAIHVDVRPSYPAVEVPIQRIATSGRSWSRMGVEQRNYVYPSETLLVSPPAQINSQSMSRRQTSQRRTLRQGTETRVITKMSIPPLESPSIGRPRNTQRSYSSDMLRDQHERSQRSRQYHQQSINDTFSRMTVREPVPTPSRRKKEHHHHHCCNRSHSFSRPSSRSRARDIYGSVRGYPMAYPTYGYTAMPVCPGYHAGFPPMSPAMYYPPEEYMQPMPYLASPAIPMQYSLPRRYPPRSARPRRTSLYPGMTPGMTPGMMPMSAMPPIYPRSSRVPMGYPCVCCPNGIHQPSARRESRVFNFDSDQWDSEGLPPSARRTLTKRSVSRQQYAQMQRMQMNGESTLEAGRKSRQTPTEFGEPMYPMEGGTPYDMASPAGTLNETTYTSQKMHSAWNATLSPRGPAGAVHGEVMRADGFPVDYVDLIDVGIEYANGEESGDEDSIPTPDRKEVIKLAENALNTASGPSQVAATLKKSMDENFGPVWHVVAGTGAYGSNIASLGGQLLHFKAFGWAFLIWKTSEQQPE